MIHFFQFTYRSGVLYIGLKLWENSMNDDYSRRQFINKTGLTLAGAGAVMTFFGCGTQEATDMTPKFQISLAEWSFHKHLFGPNRA